MITIIGGSGFVGTNLAIVLEERGDPFEILDLVISKKFPDCSRIVDITKIDDLRREISGDVVINLAAAHRDDIQDPNEYWNVNVQGAKNIAKVCEENGIRRIIFTSTVAVYGFSEESVDEHGNIQPFNEYGRTKFAAEVFRRWQREGQNSLTIVRPTVIFGEGNRGNVFNLFNRIASGKFLMVGDGNNIKSMAYIQNVSAFLACCVDRCPSLALYNYVDLPNLTVNDLVAYIFYKLKGRKSVGFRIPYTLGLLIGSVFDLFALLVGKRMPISRIRIKKFCSPTEFHSSARIDKFFTPPCTLIEGIDRTLESEFIKPDEDREVFFVE